MSFTYGPCIDNDRDAVRLTILDTDVNNPLFQDEELDYFLTQETTVISAAIVAAESLIAKFTRLGNQRVGNVSIDYSKVAEQYKTLAETLRKRRGEKGASIIVTGSGKDPSFTTTLHNSRISDCDCAAGCTCSCGC